MRTQSLDSHVSFVVLPNLLDTHIIFGIYEGLSSGIGLCQSHYTCNILEVMLIFYFDLWKWSKNQSSVRMRWQWELKLPMASAQTYTHTIAEVTQKFIG